MIPAGYLVWFAGDHAFEGNIVFANSREEAAQRGAAHLFEPTDPLECLDLFVKATGEREESAQRFRVLVDVTRARYDEQAGTMIAEGVEFTPCRVNVSEMPAA